MKQRNNRSSRLEQSFEAMIWKFRLITLIPVVMSLLGSVSCFAIGTYAELSVLARVLQGHFTHTNSTLLIGKVVGGIDYYLIGIALLIFGYGIYELVVSDIDPRQQAPSDLRQSVEHRLPGQPQTEAHQSHHRGPDRDRLQGDGELPGEHRDGTAAVLRRCVDAGLQLLADRPDREALRRSWRLL